MVRRELLLRRGCPQTHIGVTIGGGGIVVVVVVVVDPRRDTLGVAAPRAPSTAATRRLALAGVHVPENVLISHPTHYALRSGAEGKPIAIVIVSSGGEFSK